MFGLLLGIAATIPCAFAGLGRVGPVSAANGYPVWYQDRTGVTFELCQIKSAAELSGGHCLLLPADTSAPEAFPAPFADEHFYWAADAGADYTGSTGPARARMVLALEAAFANGPVVPGDQQVFGRIRIQMTDLPQTGDYIVRHPFGTWTLPGDTGGKLFYTEDIGITCQPGDFSCALLSGIGPFLMPSAAPGGAEIGPITFEGRRYIADPARIGPVTGSPIGRNFFEVVAPDGTVLVHQENFALVGRYFDSAINNQVEVNRASYSKTATATTLDVYAKAFPSLPQRVPPSPASPPYVPTLRFYAAPCDVNPSTGALAAPAGVAPAPMVNQANNYWGQSQPAVVPAEVCVEDQTRDSAGVPISVFLKSAVTDLVLVNVASYDPASGALTVEATSSDEVDAPVLTLEDGSTLTRGSIVVSPLAAPPASLRVVSSKGGIGDRPVATLPGSAGGGGGGGTAPVAANDSVTTNEDTPLSAIDVMANDSYTAPATVSIVNPPGRGTAVVNPDGTIHYTPNANVNGADTLTYTVTAGGLTSSAASVSIAITPVNDAPAANPDSTATIVGRSLSFNLLANDIDPDGAADLNDVVLGAAPAGATITSSGGVVTFSADAVGTYSFTYQARDFAAALSNVTTVTINVNTAETITATLVEYRSSSPGRFRANGTSSVAAGQTITMSYADGTSAGYVLGSAVVDAAGAWLIDLKPATTGTILDPRTSSATRVRLTSTLGAETVAPILVRR